MTGLAGCTGEKAGGASGDAVKVTLNEVAHSIFYAPMYVAVEKGYFEDEGLDVTLITGFGADKTMTALLSGEADIGFMGSESTVYTYLGGNEDYAVNFAQIRSRQNDDRPFVRGGGYRLYGIGVDSLHISRWK